MPSFPKTGFPLLLSATCALHFSRASETIFNNSNHRTLSPYCYITFLLSLGTELTENQCRSVSTSVTKSFCLFLNIQVAGACGICGPLHATKLRPQMGRDQGRLILYLRPNTLTPLVPLGRCLLFPWWLAHDISLNPFLPHFCSVPSADE